MQVNHNPSLSADVKNRIIKFDKGTCQIYPFLLQFLTSSSIMLHICSSLSFSLWKVITNYVSHKINQLAIFPLRNTYFYIHNLLTICITLYKFEVKGCLYVFERCLFMFHYFFQIISIFEDQNKINNPQII